MTESVCKAQGRIKAVKQWLNRAEDHFGRNAPVRGEMDLLLAEAELRSTRETLRAGPGHLKMSWLQQGIAFGLAAVMAVAGLGTAWWWWHDTPAEAIPVLVVSPAAPVPQIQALHISADPVQRPAPLPGIAVEFTSPAQEVKSAEKPAGKEAAVSQDEMKRLIQTAGQSLRGQTKQ